LSELERWIGALEEVFGGQISGHVIDIGDKTLVVPPESDFFAGYVRILGRSFDSSTYAGPFTPCANAVQIAVKTIAAVI
jgi:hypothetical protein